MLKSKTLFLTILFTITLIICTVFILTLCVTGKRESVPSIPEYLFALPEEKHVTSLNKNSVLKLLTLNIAHGRKHGASQIFQSKEKIQSNLDDIVSLLQRVDPDIVALQEADGPSIWSGDFSHVAYIAEKAGYYYFVRGAHVEGAMLSYGTALLSKHHLTRPVSVTFKPSPPTFSKGFVSADINTGNESKTKIVSVHLDFSRKTVREQQVKDMVDMLSVSKKSLIVMGDFNCEFKDGSAIQILAEKLNLSIYQISAENMTTFPKLKKRLDYILISQDFEFITYKVAKDIVSDHLGVVSEIREKM
ncbi:MAG: endonuclease/exonuclease/phosphatase family protein [Desulfobacteraceae bacterium]|nr:endonuclease/exonuclease/phosphatase family protein [Desulfobacteraceae bacterium]